MKEGLLKSAGFRALERSGVVAVSERFAHGVAILAYHGVTDAREAPLRNVRRLHISSSRFEQHLRLICARWRPVPLSALRDALERQRPLPSRSVVVTIDDGYRNTLTVALSLLRKFGVPATVFVLAGPWERRMWIDRLEAAVEGARVPSLRWGGRVLPLTSSPAKLAAMGALASVLEGLGGERESSLNRVLTLLGNPPVTPDPDRDLLTWDEVRELRDAGVEIGSHADRHEPLTARRPEEIEAILVRSRAKLEEELGPGLYPLSYPYGAWSPGLAAAVRAAGFSCAVTTDLGLNRVGADLFGLKRFLVGADDDIARLRTSLSGLRAMWGRGRNWSVAVRSTQSR